MRKIRTHHSFCCSHRTANIDEKSLTEQSHAHALNIKTMMASGFQYASQPPRWGDFTEIPSLDILLNNRIRLTQLYNTLPAKTRVDLPTLDSFVNVLVRNDQEELITLGLIQKTVEPQPSNDNPEPNP